MLFVAYGRKTSKCWHVEKYWLKSNFFTSVKLKEKLINNKNVNVINDKGVI